MEAVTLRGEAADLCKKLLVPAALSVAPNAWANRALDVLARRSTFFEAQCAGAWAGAADFVQRLSLDEVSFKARHRLQYLADFYDIYALLTRGSRWFERNTTIIGTPPPAGTPFIALTFHYGAGMWAHHYFASLNPRTTWLHAPVETVYRSASTSAMVARMRLRVLRRVMGNPLIVIGGSRNRMVSWLQQGGAVMAMFDAPHFDLHRTVPTRVLDGEFHLVAGIFRVAVELGVPVYLYSHMVGERAARRWLDIEGPLLATSADALLERAAAFMDHRLRADPAAWHCWNLLPMYRRPAQPAAAPASPEVSRAAAPLEG